MCMSDSLSLSLSVSLFPTHPPRSLYNLTDARCSMLMIYPLTSTTRLLVSDSAVEVKVDFNCGTSATQPDASSFVAFATRRSIATAIAAATSTEATSPALITSGCWGGGGRWLACGTGAAWALAWISMGVSVRGVCDVGASTTREGR